MAYREEVSPVTHWCQEKHLTLNVMKTKVSIVDFGRCRYAEDESWMDGYFVH